jgi:hypothetical protein
MYPELANPGEDNLVLLLMWRLRTNRAKTEKKKKKKKKKIAKLCLMCTIDHKRATTPHNMHTEYISLIDIYFSFFAHCTDYTYTGTLGTSEDRKKRRRNEEASSIQTPTGSVKSSGQTKMTVQLLFDAVLIF